MIRLRLWANARPMGWFGHAAAEFFFEYDEQWLTQPGGFMLAPQFPLASVTYRGHAVRVFFENLLPEGQALDDILAALQLRHASTLDVLGALGQELPGVLRLLKADDQPSLAQQYSPLAPDTLSARIAESATTPLLIAGGSADDATMSLAGAQDKMGLRFEPKSKRMSEGVGGSPSTHILKPDTRQLRYSPSAINEFACMKLAQAMRLKVPPVYLLRVPQTVYLIERYDRQVVADNIDCLHQIDGCQILGHGAGWKYQRSGEIVSFGKLVHALRSLRLPAADMLQLLQWQMFNFLIGNADAHAKNVSILINEQGIRLAPFYDLLCVRVYGDEKLALYIGDEDRFDAVGAHSWEALCSDCGFSYKPALATLGKMAGRLMPTWQKVLATLQKDKHLTEAERTMLGRMTAVFEEHVNWALMMTGLKGD